MPSIFVWLADQPITSLSTCTYYSGSNWFMQDNGSSCIAYEYQQQTVLPDVVGWKTKRLARDQLGSDLLEVLTVPYHLVKEDSYAILEQVGLWMRCILKKDTDYNKNMLENEWTIVQKWKSTTSLITSPTSIKNKKMTNDEEFLIRFSRDQKEK